ncbi:MAG: UDP-N-acetylmuramate dehydrogenase [Lachnospiraceae bacterium]|jgi:UDP-N-acetylmuramate dehydrogenase|nr:UDP-N-acetylmuramate dehydrogenase [Lachnospiraceae bacterium]
MEVREHEPMSRHTTFGAGGAADWFAIPESKEELVTVLTKCRNAGVPWYIIGNGSNLLVSDNGFHGVIVSTERLCALTVTPGADAKTVYLTCGAGALLPRVAVRALKEGLTGLEFAAGIPGSVGGAAAMNAGAYGGEIKDVLCSLTVLSPEGNVCELETKDLAMGYRTSAVMEQGLLVLKAVFALEKGDPAAIQSRMEELLEKRKEKQPLEYPSAGSTFKRPAGYFAGRLIEDAGLKGLSIGGAQVSEKHAGFVINRGGASASDIFCLCEEVKRRVLERFSVELELEVRLLGRF